MMRYSQKRYTLLLAALSLVGLFILASGVDTLDLRGGPLYLLPESKQETREPLPAEITQRTSNYLSLLALVFLIVLPISLLYLLLSPDARRRFLIQVVQVSLIVFFVYFLYRNIGRIFTNLRNGFSGGLAEGLEAGGVELRFLEPFTPHNPAWLTQLLSFALAAGFVYFLFWLWKKRWQIDDRLSTPAEKLVRSAQSALRRIDAGQNLRDVVLRCYQEMTQAVAEKRHITRPEYATPHEFIRSLEAAGLPAEQVGRLTDLFEAVRYGHKIPGAQERAEAVACLKAVVERLGSQP
jgi:hypothetical protein